jgi:hypothetical protein
MADAESGMGSQKLGRQQRTRQPKQPGATGEGRDEETSAKEARNKTLHREGKTQKHTSDDRRQSGGEEG